jgi:hypothetical protein
MFDGPGYMPGPFFYVLVLWQLGNESTHPVDATFELGSLNMSVTRERRALESPASTGRASL